MKRFLLIFFSLVAITSFAFAQNVKNKYKMRITDDGTILFIYPQEGYKSKKMSSNLVYDATYSSITDSVIVNFTYINKAQIPFPLDSVVVISGESRYIFPSTMLYMEPKKGDKWENRASIKLQAEDFKAIYAEETPAELLFYIRQEDYSFKISEKAWRNNAGIINKIFEIAKYNY